MRAFAHRAGHISFTLIRLACKAGVSEPSYAFVSASAVRRRHVATCAGAKKMKALVLYSVFVAIGAFASAAVGFYVETEVSATLSLVVFLCLFFANFVVSWLAVVLVMDGSLKNAQGRQEQLDIEKAGQAMMAAHRKGA
jgi:hypothetical protein